jgi:hypothetical protein
MQFKIISALALASLAAGKFYIFSAPIVEVLILSNQPPPSPALEEEEAEAPQLPSAAQVPVCSNFLES